MENFIRPLWQRSDRGLNNQRERDRMHLNFKKAYPSLNLLKPLCRKLFPHDNSECLRNLSER